MQLPTAREINPIPEDLDGATAERHFLGKTLAEAAALFAEAFEIYQEDLLFMGPKAFCFYLPAAVIYAESDDAAGDGYVADTMLTILARRWEIDRRDIESVGDLIGEFTSRLHSRLEQLDVDDDERRRLGQACERLIEHLEFSPRDGE